MSGVPISSHVRELYSLYSIGSSQFFIKLQILYNIACRAYWSTNLDKFKNSDGSIREYDALIGAFNMVGLENRLLRSFSSNWRTANEIKHGKTDFVFEHNYAHLCAENYNKTIRALFDDISDKNEYFLEMDRLSLQESGKSAFELAFYDALDEKSIAADKVKEDATDAYLEAEAEKFHGSQIDTGPVQSVQSVMTQTSEFKGIQTPQVMFGVLSFFRHLRRKFSIKDKVK